MPYIPSERRGEGPRVFGDVDPGHRGDHYADRDLGRRCATCGMRMVGALEAEGFDTHPSCPDPEPDCRKCNGVDARWHDRDCPRRRRKGRG